ncbi:MAG: BspA family leucine-rich repeat surface protein, partial [Candidatus Binatia bacterium]
MRSPLDGPLRGFRSPFGVVSVAAVPAFVSTWETSNTSTGSSTSTQIALPLTSAGTYAFDVDWGDGSSDTITVWDQAETTHTYASAGEYEVRITGTIEGWRFNNGGDKLKILAAVGGGILNPGSDNGQFYGCSNMASLSGLVTAGVTDMAVMFRDCSGLTALDVTGFNTSSVSSMAFMFNGCSGLTALDVTG